jgi:hypothetical protein
MFDIIPQKHLSRKNWREALRYANGQHLNYNFGWKPFVKDVVNVFNGVADHENRLKRFVRKQNWDLCRKTGDEELTSTSTFYVEADGYTDHHCLETTYTVFGASAFQFDYEIPHYSDRELFWRSMADTLGLNIGPATIWAVLPWSFVVDWFVDVGGFLRQFETDWVQPWVNFFQACQTYHVSAVTDVKFRFTYSQCPWVPWARFTTHKFSRTVGLPGLYLPDPTSLNADKIRLLGSLIYSRF